MKGTIFSTILLTLCLFQISYSEKLRPGQALYLSGTSLKFKNETSGVNQEMLDRFIGIANFASLIYGSDIEKTIKYIKLRMDELYGGGQITFSIFIQTDEVTSGRYLWSYPFDIYASLYGINKMYPEWSYLFIRTIGSNNIAEYAYISMGDIGSEMQAWVYDIVIWAIVKYEDGCSCSRPSLMKMIYEILQESGWWFNIICDDKGVTHSLVFPQEQKWMTTMYRNCYYSLYDF